LNGAKLRNLSLPQIPVADQRRIVAYLDDLQEQVDTLKALQAEASGELDALMPSILDKAFRGEL
jgi:type I restriction enzyme S subunit